MFETSRLKFSLITNRDFGRVYETLNNQRTCEMLSFMRWPLTDEQVTYWCNKAKAGAANKSEYLLIAYNGEDAIGCIGIHKDEDNNHSAEVGYWVAAAHQRQGYANEMLTGAIAFAENTLGITNFHATADTQNPASGNLLTKHGFTESGEKIVESKHNAPRTSKFFTR